jgi:hypothetical protein
MEREMENCKATGIRNEALAKEKKKSNEAVTNHFFLNKGFLFLFLFFLCADLRQNSYKILSKRLEKC